jgi:hypothetical protein
MTRRLSIAVAVAAGAAVLGTVVIALPASAATPNLQISLVQFDSPSNPDTNATSSVNGEYLRIYNNSTFTAALGRFTIRDAAGHTFTFPARSIGAKKTVYIHSGKGTDGYQPNGTRDSARLYQQSGWHIWNNTGDTATLRSATGRIYDTCKWTSRGTGKTTCGSLGKTAVGPNVPATVTPPPPAASPTPSTAPSITRPPASSRPPGSPSSSPSDESSPSSPPPAEPPIG